MPLVYAYNKMEKLEEPGCLLMEDFCSRDGGVVNKADGFNLEQACIFSLVKCFLNIFSGKIPGKKHCAPVCLRAEAERPSYLTFHFYKEVI